MAALTVNVLPECEVAAILRRFLGPQRDWKEALSDMRRGRGGQHDLFLLPLGKFKDKTGWRPGYLPENISDFIKGVRDSDTTAGANIPPKTFAVEIDDIIFNLPPELRKNCRMANVAK